jgi:hypothetical protein
MYFSRQMTTAEARRSYFVALFLSNFGTIQLVTLADLERA